MSKTTTKLTYSAMCIALATLFSYFKLYEFPFGGSVTCFSMLMICLPGYWFGLGTGLIAAIGYGVLQLLLDPYVLFPLQLIVDYLLAFGALGLSGVFCRKTNQAGAFSRLMSAYLLGICGRYVFTVLSGWLFFAEYAWEGWNPLPYSLVYNGAYIFTEGLLTLLLLALPPVKKTILKLGQ